VELDVEDEDGPTVKELQCMLEQVDGMGSEEFHAKACGTERDNRQGLFI